MVLRPSLFCTLMGGGYTVELGKEWKILAKESVAVLLLGLDSWWTHWALAVGSDHNWGNRAVALRGFSPETGELPVRRAGLRYRVPSHGDPYVDVVSRDPVLKPILS